MSTIMALDVSLARTGVALLVDGEFVGHAIIATKARAPRHARLGQIAAEAASLMCQYRPDIVAIETSAGWQRMSHDSRASIEALAQARAAVLIAADSWVQEHGARVLEMGPSYVRSIVCCNAHASKEQVAANLKQRGFVLPVRRNGQEDLDVADSLALGYAVWCEMRLVSLAKEATP